MSRAPAIPLIPAMVGFGLRPLPLAPLAVALGTLARSLARRHESMFVRLGVHAAKRFLIEPTDLPFILVVTPQADDPAINIERSRDGLAYDARIAGPLAALIGLLNGEYDGDALFFAGDLVIEGDVEAVLALRNALDDAEIDLIADAAAVLGPLAAPAERIGRLAAAALEQLTGIAIARPRSGMR